jgi:uncharacterized protein (DUF433 family)
MSVVRSSQGELGYELKRRWEMAKQQRKTLGRYIVADPKICHGKPTFTGTRIMVSQVLSQVASGMSWREISTEWRGKVNKAAIAEAIDLAGRIFKDHAKDYAESLSA